MTFDLCDRRGSVLLLYITKRNMNKSKEVTNPQGQCQRRVAGTASLALAHGRHAQGALQ